MKKLVRTINGYLGEKGIKEKQLDKSFELSWPSFQKSLAEILNSPEPAMDRRPQRTQESILEEILRLTRAIAVEFPKISGNPQIHPIVPKWDKEFTKLVWNTLVDIWDSGSRNIRSVEIFDKLMSMGESVRENAMEKSLGHLIELGCISGKIETNSAGDIRKHGSIVVVSVNKDCAKDF